jgi:hypothetical protein
MVQRRDGSLQCQNIAEQPVMSKHLVVRATSDLHERQALKAELWRLSEAEQEAL